MSTLPHMQALLEIMAKLRDKEHGCPWDIEQNFASIAPYTVEEAYEVMQAIEDGDMQALQSELGDLLLQVVFHAQMAAEEKAFSFEDVAEGIAKKMIRRHPHVFGEKDIPTADAQTESWEAIKAAERKENAQQGILDDIPLALPALMRSQKLQKRAARVGFDWPDIAPVYAKVEEELTEVREAQTPEHITEEIGDLLFAVVNLARHHKVDAEDALRSANRKFETRFGYVEKEVEQSSKAFDAHSIDELEAFWKRAKKA